MLYAYYYFNVCFLKWFVIRIILDKFGPKSDAVPVDGNPVFVYTGPDRIRGIRGNGGIRGIL